MIDLRHKALQPLELGLGLRLGLGSGGASGPFIPGLSTVPKVIYGAGDSILGGSAPGYYSFFTEMPERGAYVAVNKGRPGSYSSVSNTNFDADCLNPTFPSADIVVICDATNDRGGAVQTISAATADGNPGKGVWNVRDMATRVLAAGKKVAICSINHLADGTKYASTNFICDTLKADVTDPAGQFYSAYLAKNAIFVDFRPVMSDLGTGIALDATYYADNTHPSNIGGALMSATLDAAMIAAGWISSLNYPYTRNQSISSDPRNIFTAARGTMQGTGGTGGAAQGWQFITNTDGLGSIILGGAAPSPSLGKTQKLRLAPGQASLCALQFVFSGITAYQNHKLFVGFRTLGTNLNANGAKFQPKITTSGGTNWFPLNGAANLLSSANMEGSVFHSVYLTVPGAATNLTAQIISGGNPGASNADIEIYDLIGIDLGV
jgi:hypothetical protein